MRRHSEKGCEKVVGRRVLREKRGEREREKREERREKREERREKREKREKRREKRKVVQSRFLGRGMR